MEDIVDRAAENERQPHRQLKRWRVTTRLQRNDRLARHTRRLGEGVLRHLAMIEAQPTKVVRDRQFTHRPVRLALGTSSRAVG